MTAVDEKTSSRWLALDALRSAQKFVVVTHERPDGDAIGSLVGMQLVLDRLGKDALAYLPVEEFPLPREYAWMQIGRLVTEAPDDLADRVAVFLDCGNVERSRATSFVDGASRVLNLDHHHDNTRFGTVDHVVADASCTAEIVWDLMAALGVSLDAEIGQALYVGLVTDTGRFMYENTSARSHEMAAAIIRAGVDVHEIYRRLYEGVPPGKLKLLARGLANLHRYEDGRLTLSWLTCEDFKHADAVESFAEGVVDHLRALEGTAVAGLVRQLDTGSAEVLRKVSLRATDDRVDVSRIARAMGGGGHRRAAGFTTQLGIEQLVDFLRREVRAQL